MGKGRTIELPCFGITIDLAGGGGSITSELKNDDPEGEDNTLYLAAIDGIESMILAHAMAGIDVESPAYMEGIETAANNL